MPKQQEYDQLVQKRKVCSVCLGLVNASKVAGGAYDADEIGAWTRWQGDINASLMVVGQDWGDEVSLIKQHGLEPDRNRTNDTLIELIHSLGYPMKHPSEGQQRSDGLFLTNAILCLKQGGLQGPVQADWFANCGSRFLRETVRIVQPAVLVTLGAHAYRAVCASFGLSEMVFRQAVENTSGQQLPNRTWLFPVYHCGARILNTHRKIDQQRLDWQRIGKAIEAMKAKR